MEGPRKVGSVPPVDTKPGTGSESRLGSYRQAGGLKEAFLQVTWPFHLWICVQRHQASCDHVMHGERYHAYRAQEGGHRGFHFWTSQEQLPSCTLPAVSLSSPTLDIWVLWAGSYFLGSPGPPCHLLGCGCTSLTSKCYWAQSVQVLINAFWSCTPAHQQHNTHQGPIHRYQTNGTFPVQREYLQGYHVHSPGWGEWRWDKVNNSLVGEVVSCIQSFDPLWASKSGPWAWSTSSLRDRAFTSVLDLPLYAETSFPVSDSMWILWFYLSVCIWCLAKPTALSVPLWG